MVLPHQLPAKRRPAASAPASNAHEQRLHHTKFATELIFQWITGVWNQKGQDSPCPYQNGCFLADVDARQIAHAPEL
jgi:hypothetical protein